MMRKFDKLHNLKKANLLAEQRYLESKGFIEEEIEPKRGDEIIWVGDARKIDDNTGEMVTPNMKGEYNIQRAITTFNKRIAPLLVVFKEEVRNRLIVNNPEDRGFFTKSQCELINGVPFKEGDQDTLEEVLTLSDGEVKYWNKRGMSPDYIYELASEGWEKFIN